MKNIKIYLLMATLVFSTTACLDKYPDDMARLCSNTDYQHVECTSERIAPGS